MKINLAVWDRVIRFILGVLLTAWGIAGGPWWSFVGVYLVFTGSWGLCPIYSLFKIRTAPLKNRVPHSPES